MTLPRLLTAAVLMLAPSNYEAPAAPGDLDTSFGGGDGIVTTFVSFGGAKGRSAAVQNDGKIIVTGSASSRFLLARYNSDGSLDSTFDGTGVVTTLFGDICGAYSLAVQQDGKMVVAGTARFGSNADFAVARYTKAGELDLSFNGTGCVLTDLGTNADGARSVALQSDGKIVVSGLTDLSGDSVLAVARYTGAGALDSGFNGTGVVVAPIDQDPLSLECSVTIQPDGKIIVAGSSNNSGTVYDFAVLRYTSAGILDPSFNGTGIVSTHFSLHDGANCVTVQNDGNILAAGYWSNTRGSGDVAVVRYTDAGSLDTSFSDDGKATTSIIGSYDLAQSIAVQSDGKIVVAGYTDDIGSNNQDFALIRYTSTGAIDTSFGGGDGIVTTTISTSSDTGYSVVLQSDGKILVVGEASISNIPEVALVRYEGDPPADTDTDGLLDQWEFNNWRTMTGHGAMDDADHDGYCELLEQAFGLNPNFPDATGLPPPVVEGGYLTMTITKQPGVTYEVQSAGTLLPALPESFSAANTTVLINNATTLKARDNFLISSSPPRFMRVKVTAAP